MDSVSGDLHNKVVQERNSDDVFVHEDGENEDIYIAPPAVEVIALPDSEENNQDCDQSPSEIEHENIEIPETGSLESSETSINSSFVDLSLTTNFDEDDEEAEDDDVEQDNAAADDDVEGEESEENFNIDNSFNIISSNMNPQDEGKHDNNIEDMNSQVGLTDDIGNKRIPLPELEKARNERCATLIHYLKSYEVSRKQSLDEAFSNTQIYWKAVMVLLDNAVMQERQFLTMLTVKQNAERTYANNLLTINTELMKTATVTAIQEQELELSLQRRKSNATILLSPAQQHIAHSSTFAVKERRPSATTTTTTSSEKTSKNKNNIPIFCENMPNHVMHVMEAQVAMGKVYDQFATKVESLHTKVEKSFEELQLLVEELNNEGAETLKSVNTARQRALDCFAQFYQVAMGSENSKVELESTRPRTSSDASKSTTAALATNPIILSDAWLQESLYRCAVKECQNAWSICSGVLKDLFTRAHKLEQARRLQTLKYMQALTKAQTDMWQKQLPPCSTNAVSSVAKASKDKVLISKAESAIDIKQMVKLYALEIQKSESSLGGPPSKLINADSITDELFPPGTSSSTSRPITEADVHIHNDGYDSEDDELLDDVHRRSEGHQSDEDDAKKPFSAGYLKSLESAMLSPLLMRGRILERKSPGTFFDGWCYCLALLTFDSYLHIYDIPSEMMKKFISKSIKKLKLNNVIIHKNLKDKKKQEIDNISIIEVYHQLCQNNIKQSEHFEVPLIFRSININKCTCTWKPNDDTSDCLTFLIEEIYERKNAIFLSKEATRSLTLRCTSQEEMVDWCVQIKHAKR